ncbi:MAG: methylase [Clostridiales bacterium]|nr:methylase [Clostridiales bacterium]
MIQSAQKKNARDFAKKWSGIGDEKQQTQAFWNSLLRTVFDVEDVEDYVEYEKPVVIDNKSFIDAYIKDTRVLIEQKSLGIDLRKKEKQSDGSELTPYEQANRYAVALPNNVRPDWIIVCNFGEFIIYDENINRKKRGDTREVASFKLSELEDNYHLLDFIVDKNQRDIQKETQVSFEAGQIVGKIYDALIKQYLFINEKDDNGKATERAVKEQQSLNRLCVRLVFCLYAEDSGLFEQKNQFHDYLMQYNANTLRGAIIELFKVLDTPIEQRNPYDDAALLAFPYVNGSLFSNDGLIIPQMTDEIRDVLINHASTDFDWSTISPTIFGAVFESTLNPETRRSGGMHYTSIENIHKVIDPLFLDGLKEELCVLKSKKTNIERRVAAFQNKLSSLKFLDPACGSGNFLTETYISLRKLENEALAFKQKGNLSMALDGTFDPIKVSINQFYGIEINDFAVAVAKTALWIAEHQMMKETEEILLGMDDDFLPLHTNANIVEGNALRMDWNEVVSKDELTYIIGNPPFIGAMHCKGEKRKEVANAFPECKKSGEIDYVAGWYSKAARYIQTTYIKCAFVSTNSICQGQQVALIWKPLIETYNIDIDFAYRTFRWDNEANSIAKVHCVIIGFSNFRKGKVKVIYDGKNQYEASNISPYLLDVKTVFIESRKTPICNVQKMDFGSMPRDGGGFILNAEQRKDLIKREPIAKKWIKPYIGSEEFLKNKERYCLWLKDAVPSEINRCPTIKERIEYVRRFRIESKASATRRFAETPTLFCQIAQPETDYLLIPRHSSERRKYIPIGFMSPDIIASDAVLIVPNATLFDFGILTSSVHNSWMRLIAGRLKSDYRYSKDIVYNNFPWPSPSPQQKEKIEATAQSILDARALYPDSSLADLYDPLTMPPELLNAHKANDKAVMQAYGFKSSMSESDIVSELMKMYQDLIAKEQNQ